MRCGKARLLRVLLFHLELREVWPVHACMRRVSEWVQARMCAVCACENLWGISVFRL